MYEITGVKSCSVDAAVALGKAGQRGPMLLTERSAGVVMLVAQ